MSQRRFSTERYDVLMGWDRPLRRFFLTVFDSNAPENAQTDVVYDYWESQPVIGIKPGAFGLPMPMFGPVETNYQRQLDEMLVKLTKMGIEYPTILRADLEEDRSLARGNFVHNYGRVNHGS